MAGASAERLTAASISSPEYFGREAAGDGTCASSGSSSPASSPATTGVSGTLGTGDSGSGIMSQSGRSSWDEFGGTGECALASAPCPGSTPVVPEPPSGGRSIATATLPPADRPCLSVATSDFLPSSEPVARSPEFDGSSLVTPASRGFTTHGRSPSLIARDLHMKGPGIVTISTTPSTKSSGVPGPRDSQKASKNACSSTGATRASTTGPSR